MTHKESTELKEGEFVQRQTWMFEGGFCPNVPFHKVASVINCKGKTKTFILRMVFLQSDSVNECRTSVFLSQKEIKSQFIKIYQKII